MLGVGPRYVFGGEAKVWFLEGGAKVCWGGVKVMLGRSQGDAGDRDE